jgi:dolichyl-diphosphooligosaccharide--protein glycosyltransferase
MLCQSGQQAGGYGRFFPKKEPYYESTAVRLYHYHGSAVEPSPVVLDWEMETIQGQTWPVSQGVEQFDTMEQARNYTQNDPTSQIGGVGSYPTDRVQALEHYRLVGTSERSASQTSRGYLQSKLFEAQGGFGVQLESLGQLAANQRWMRQNIQFTEPYWVKVFERVDGATIEGEGAPANSEVEVAVRMNVPAGDSSFVYRAQTTADEDGEFELTVPYSTTGYDEWGPDEGYTNVSVRSDMPYRVRTEQFTNETGYTYRYNGTVHVSEGQVIGEDDSAATVELERGPMRPPEGATVNDGSENAGDGSGSDGSDGADDGGDQTGTATPTATPTGTTEPTGTATADGSASLSGPGPLESALAMGAPLLGLVGLAAVGRAN